MRARAAVGFLLVALLAAPAAAQQARGRGAPVDLGREVANDRFAFTYDARGVTSVRSPQDPFNAALFRGPRLGLYGKHKTAGAGSWTDLPASAPPVSDGATIACTTPPGSPLQITQSYTLDGPALDWSITLEAGDQPVEVGDLALLLPWTRPAGDPRTIFEQGFIKHQFISGAGSFLYFVRPSGVGPHLLATVKPSTHLQYSATVGGAPGGRGNRGSAATSPAPSGFAAFIHSAVTGNAEQRGTWRQPHTALSLAPRQKVTYGLRLQWCPTYDAMRDALYNEGLFDIRVIPGMTVPENLAARFSLRTKAKIEAIDAEFPDQTRIERIRPGNLGPAAGDLPVYAVQFAKLGENRLTIRHDGGRKTYLEFFCTETLETLIKKRANFIATRQQWRDPSKWYDGLFSVYDMQAKKLRSPEDTDGWSGRNEYILASDDPALCKAPYVAAKNVHFPVKEEIEAVEYYLREYVWGGLQRTDKETPYPYGIYGIPNWHVQRTPDLKRTFETDANRRPDLVQKLRIFRSYDYPHMVMLYYHMYEIAKFYPHLVSYLDADRYLERAYQTARAYFVYPTELLPGYYETYKWGCYNELLIPQLIETLEQKGQKSKADYLRAEWEKKVKYFVYDDPYPFRSEYAFDRTAFESSYALAKYGSITDMKPDEKLWRDPKVWFDSNGTQEKWYSHPVVKREDSRAFMDRQHLAGLAVRGVLEPAYYLLGADATGGASSMSYMAQMGGWSILDYGLNFAPDPRDALQLGYQSYLSAWALMNTGRPDTNYGFWFPGKENDGATGWTFSNAKFARGWYGKDDPRGPWHYDGEIDLGYGAALRMAATVITRDPVFGQVAYGGAYEGEFVEPRDGLRKRFVAILSKGNVTTRFKVELERDAFAAGLPMFFNEDPQRLVFTLETLTNEPHRTGLRLSLPADNYRVLQNGKEIPLTQTGNWDHPLRAELDGIDGSRIQILQR